MQDGSYLPDLVVFLHPGDCSHGVRECTNRNVPTIGVVDSDTDPRMVTYPIPANIQVSYLGNLLRHSSCD